MELAPSNHLMRWVVNEQSSATTEVSRACIGGAVASASEQTGVTLRSGLKPFELTLPPGQNTFRVMRLFLAGLLVLILPGTVLAQAKGQVLGVGFDNRFRPDCWTPMLVQLSSQSSESRTYQIQIVQEDRDRDHVTYTQQVTLGENVEGQSQTTENFWVYFIPKPSDGGLPDPSYSLKTLNEQLKVFLCDEKGNQLATLPLTSTVITVDPIHGIGDDRRGRKLILFVTDGTDKPAFPDYPSQRALLQDIEVVKVSPRDLPTNLIGYEAVDDIVWMDADANFLTTGTHTPALEAIVQWIHQGGHLIVCQPAEAQKIRPFADLLPVGAQMNGQWTIPMVDRPDSDVLRSLMIPDSQPDSLKWPEHMGPFKMGQAPVLPGAKVDDWMQWGEGADATYTPWLARRCVGLGAVTWVAQDLGNAGLTERVGHNWRYVWDHVLGWNNPDSVPENYTAPGTQAGAQSGGGLPAPGANQNQGVGSDPWGTPNKVLDLGDVLRGGLDSERKVLVLLGIACVFFIVYGLAAGPGSYVLLRAWKRVELSWYAFAATALLATGATALIVKAVVRGPPVLHHLSFVRHATGEAGTVIDSQIGLYIPQDADQKLSLAPGEPHEVSYIAPLNGHPQYDDSEAVGDYMKYEVPVRDATETDGAKVTIPYRSSSKKLLLHWVGEQSARIEVPAGMPDLRIDPAKKLEGSLINHTGYDLWHVFFAFSAPEAGSSGTTKPQNRDYILYVEFWPKESVIKLEDLFSSKNIMSLDADPGRKPMGSDPVWGFMGSENDTSAGWSRYWRDRGSDVASDIDCAIPMLALFDHLPPWKIAEDKPRYELLTRGGRKLNLSAALSGGGLVIFGRGIVERDTARTDLPVPFSVQDSPVNGTGTTIFEFVLPVDRTAVSAPPSTQPTTQPG
jgi:hypothetical protein